MCGMVWFLIYSHYLYIFLQHGSSSSRNQIVMQKILKLYASILLLFFFAFKPWLQKVIQAVSPLLVQFFNNTVFQKPLKMSFFLLARDISCKITNSNSQRNPKQTHFQISSEGLDMGGDPILLTDVYSDIYFYLYLYLFFHISNLDKSLTKPCKECFRTR